MSNIDWRRVQAALAAAGRDPGPIDGALGRRTTLALMSLAARRAPDETMTALSAGLANAMPRFGISDTAPRIAEFLAETCHETGGYTTLAENMRYSAKRLMAVWPRRFPTLVSALPFSWDPSDPDREDVALANYVYGSRMGNDQNGTDDNDGWDNRGGGMLQHTGAAEYEALRKRQSLTSEMVRSPEWAPLAACDYWDRKGLNALADAGRYTDVRRRINGGEIGLAEVAGIRKRVMGVLT